MTMAVRALLQVCRWQDRQLRLQSSETALGARPTR